MPKHKSMAAMRQHERTESKSEREMEYGKPKAKKAVKKGYHKMPNGKIMKGTKHK
jgi:hypothetical protein